MSSSSCDVTTNFGCWSFAESRGRLVCWCVDDDDDDDDWEESVDEDLLQDDDDIFSWSN